MRIARWVDGAGASGEGFVIEDRVVPFPDGLTVADVLTQGLDAAHALLARAGDSGGDAGPAGSALADVQLRAPLVPAAIRDFVAFEEHVEGVSASVDGKSEVVAEWYQAPTFYFTNPHTVLGPGEPVRPPVSERLDFELELAVVIGAAPGSDGTNLTPEAAASHIFGYTIMNDWSARDLQAREMKVRLGPAKGKDFGTSLGPWIVTADELAPFLDDDGFLSVRAEVFVGETLIGEDLVSNMGWPFPELIAYAARNSRVVPGDVLGSGTVGNGGCLAELWGRRGSLTPPPLVEGDEVRMVVEGIGELVARVAAPVSAPALPGARSRSRARSVLPARLHPDVETAGKPLSLDVPLQSRGRQGRSDLAPAELFSCAGQVAIVTGGATGLGLASAEALAAAGARVVIAGIRSSAPERAANDLAERGLEVVGVECDVTDAASLSSLVENTARRFGRIDTILANAGVALDDPNAADHDDALERMFALHVRSVSRLAHLALPIVAGGGGGSFIVMSSIAGLRGNRAIAGYGVTKAANAQIARNLAVQWGARGIRANAISPGAIATEFAKPITENPDIAPARLKKTPLGRFGVPLEIAGAVVWLASPAGAFVTGQNIAIDGGTLISD